MSRLKRTWERTKVISNITLTCGMLPKVFSFCVLIHIIIIFRMSWCNHAMVWYVLEDLILSLYLGIYKKLLAAGKKKGCQILTEWAQSISNHKFKSKRLVHIRLNVVDVYIYKFIKLSFLFRRIINHDKRNKINFNSECSNSVSL